MFNLAYLHEKRIFTMQLYKEWTMQQQSEYTKNAMMVIDWVYITNGQKLEPGVW